MRRRLEINFSFPDSFSRLFLLSIFHYLPEHAWLIRYPSVTLLETSLFATVMPHAFCSNMVLLLAVFHGKGPFARSAAGIYGSYLFLHLALTQQRPLYGAKGREGRNSIHRICTVVRKQCKPDVWTKFTAYNR